MTGLLKDALTERAAAEEAPHLDLDAIVRTGDRRLHRRRGLVGLAAAAVVIVAAGGAVMFDRTNADGPATRTPFAERRVTWASGNTIHYGDRDIPVGPATISAFVQTDSGFVLTDPSGVVYVADGRIVTRIGAGNRSQRLSADDTGSWVGCVDHTAAVPESVVYDIASRHELLRTAEGNTAGMDPWPRRRRLQLWTSTKVTHTSLPRTACVVGRSRPGAGRCSSVGSAASRCSTSQPGRSRSRVLPGQMWTSP